MHPRRPALTLNPVVGGIVKPVLVTNAGDARLFVLGQLGVIEVGCDGELLPAPFLDISPKVSCCGEDGLLGLAFHPDYAANGRLFITYVDKASADTILAEYHVDPVDPNRADPASGHVLLRLRKPFRFHWAGGLAFGRDGFLYLGTGDGGHGTGIHAAGDVLDLGQRTDTLLGKILRIDIDHGATPRRAYGIPPDNPFVGRSGRDEIWAYGLRNPWRWSIDAPTGDLWIGDVGHNRWEEVDRAPGDHGSVGGRGVNFGWRILEGVVCYEPAYGCHRSGTQLPVAVYGHGSITTPTRSCAVIGGYVYRGAAEPALAGRYYFADYCSGRILSLPANAHPDLART